MKLYQLRDVIAVAETGSLRGASRQLGIGQPSISRSIRNVEQELGVPLFTRHTRGVALTDMGKAFVRRAVTVEHELRRAREEIAQMSGEFTGQVSIAMASASAIALMPSILPNFRKRYPDALLKVTESLFKPIEAEILSGEMDFFVGPLDEHLSATSLTVEKLFDNRRVVLCRKGHALAGSQTLAELADAQWIRPSFSTAYGEADFHAIFERAGLPQPKVVMQTRSTLMTLLGVVNSELLTVLPTQWLDFSATAEGARAVDLKETQHAAPVCLVYRTDVPLTPLAEHLSDVVRKAGLNYALRKPPA